jgi:hypothetical protein
LSLFAVALFLVVDVYQGIANFGYLVGAFSLLLCLCVFLTNQLHKWAHMEETPVFVAWLQERGLNLSQEHHQEHHDIHHESPYDTYYCITVGVWNPLLDRLRFFERTERLLRRVTPGTHPNSGPSERGIWTTCEIGFGPYWSGS